MIKHMLVDLLIFFYCACTLSLQGCLIFFTKKTKKRQRRYFAAPLNLALRLSVAITPLHPLVPPSPAGE